MIQRQQTLWLLLAAIAALLTFMFPIITGSVVENNVVTYASVKAGSSFIILVLTGIALCLAGVAIFVYSNRRQQMMLCIIGAVVTVGIIILYFLELKKMTAGTLAFSGILPFLMLAGFILAWRNIRKDEKLIKSLDKLR